jgi:hypothetical protein
MQILISLLFICVFIQVQAQDFGSIQPTIKFNTTTNQQANIVFPIALPKHAQYINQIFQILDSTTKHTIGKSTKKWNVVLQHQTIIPNAYVRMAPKLSEFYLTPDMDNLQSGTLPWVQLLATHEYRHIQQFSNFNNGLTKLFSAILGEQGQLLANGITVPNYFFEGDAVYQETITTNQGRGQLPSFFAPVKALAQSNIKLNWQQIRNGSLRYNIPNHYLTGYQLVTYGYQHFGDQFWKNVTYDATRFKGLFYAFNKAVSKHSNLSYKQFRNNAMAEVTKSITDVDKQNAYQYITINKPKTYSNYLFPQINNKQLVYLKETYNTRPAFYTKNENVEKRIAFKHFGIDNYFNVKNNKIVYTCYDKNSRYANTNYSNLVILDINSGLHNIITSKGKYFHPSFNNDASKIATIQYTENGMSNLLVINASNNDTQIFASSQNEIYTYPFFINEMQIGTIKRNSDGSNQLIKVNLKDNKETAITPATYKAMGQPNICGDTILFVLANNNSEQIAAHVLATNKTYLLTNNVNSFYYPTINNENLLFSKLTAAGELLSAMPNSTLLWQEINAEQWQSNAVTYYESAFAKKANLQLPNPNYNNKDTLIAKHYHKAKHGFKFHSYQPTVDLNSIGLSFFTDNILSTVSGQLFIGRNLNENSTALGFNANFGGRFPIFTLGTAFNFNRSIASFIPTFNTANVYTGVSVPLSYYRGRFFRTARFSTLFNTEQLYYNGIGKQIFNNKSFQYLSYGLSLSNQVQTAVQHINPKWAQAISISFRDGIKKVSTKKMVINSRLFFPGVAKNHSLVLSTSYQKRDTTIDYFTNTFNFARGYQPLNTRRMAKLGVDYHFPIAYPDFGFGNIAFIQRIRGNVFFDINNSKARLGGILQNVMYKSMGAEVYFDGQIWNSFPINIGFRYTKLLDKDLIQPLRKSLFEIVLPLDIIPN